VDPRSRFFSEHPAIGAGCLGALALPFVVLLVLILLSWPTPGGAPWPAVAGGGGLCAVVGVFSLWYWSERHVSRPPGIWNPWLGVIVIPAPLALLLVPAEQLHVAATAYAALWCAVLCVWGVGTATRGALTSGLVAARKKEPPVHQVDVCEARPPTGVAGEALYVAACECGWIGEEHVAGDPDAVRKAFADARSHSQHVSQVIRRPNRNDAG
jgi:hypothetical protein